MRYDVKAVLMGYNGKPLIGADGQAATLKTLIEMSCIGADPQEFSSLEKKLQIHKLLIRVYNSVDTVELSSEEVTLVKQISTKVLSVVALGTLVDILENRQVEVPNEST